MPAAQPQPLQAQQVPAAQQVPGAQPMPAAQQMPGAQQMGMPAAQPMWTQPMQGAQPMPSAAPYAQGGAVAARRGVPVVAIVVGIVVVVAAAVVAAGLFTNWFGLLGKPVYIMTKETGYDSSGEMDYSLEMELDGRGNAVKMEENLYDSSGVISIVTEYENDSNGFAQKATIVETAQNGEETKRTETYEYKFDSRGRVEEVELTSDTKTRTSSYGYYGNGSVSSLKSRYVLEAGGSGTNECKYDEGGYLTSVSAASEKSDSSSASHASRDTSDFELKWEFDSANAPIGYTLLVEVTEDSEKHTGSIEFTVETDGHGNITAIYDSEGAKVAEYEYELVNNPSENARLSASMKPYLIQYTWGSLS